MTRRRSDFASERRARRVALADGTVGAQFTRDPSHSRMRTFLALPLFALLAVGCDSSGIEVDFGDPYRVAPGADVTLEGLTLRVPVTYSGGCAEHRFRPFSDFQTEDTTRLWLVHDANGDTCEALITDTLDVQLSGADLVPPHLDLVIPADNGAGEATIRVR